MTRTLLLDIVLPRFVVNVPVIVTLVPAGTSLTGSLVTITFCLPTMNVVLYSYALYFALPLYPTERLFVPTLVTKIDMLNLPLLSVLE